MKIHHLAKNLSMIDVEPPIPGWEEFISVYVLKGQQVALVDVGPQSSVGGLIDGLKALKVNPDEVSHVLLTHIHLDHAGAIGELPEFLPNAMVVVHPKGAPHLANTEKLWEGSLKVIGDLAVQYGRPKNIPKERVIAAEDGLLIALGNGIELEVIHTPGHAAHHLSFFERESGSLFAGEVGGTYTSKIDLLRPATPPPLSLEHEVASIDRLLERKLTTIYNSHFGAGGDAPSQLRREKEQLELWRKVIAEALNRGKETKSIFSELVAKDSLLEGLKRLPQAQYQRECYFINNSIKGFLGYIKG
jgi:glyoxylase-like metal-dependent hydrolase (beta-lactamase superfamily II)